MKTNRFKWFLLIEILSIIFNVILFLFIHHNIGYYVIVIIAITLFFTAFQLLDYKYKFKILN